MRRCGAIAIQRAIKELRKAQKNAGSVWAQALNLQISSLADILIYTENADLLDSRTAQEKLKEIADRKARDAKMDRFPDPPDLLTTDDE